jgi:hypothetical protein
MPRWLPRVLARIHQLAAERRVQCTEKAFSELRGLPLGIDADDASHILENLTASECAGRLASRESGEWLYAFIPRIGGVPLYVKLALRAQCVVVSFHEDHGDDDENREPRPKR